MVDLKLPKWGFVLGLVGCLIIGAVDGAHAENKGNLIKSHRNPSQVANEKLGKFNLQLKWLPQAQFAGYYVAKEKGFYDKLGVEITIIPGGPDIIPMLQLVIGAADIIVEWMPFALASREEGVPVVNIAQPFKKSGMMLTCRKDSGIRSPEDLRGKTVGVWYNGSEYSFLSWMSTLGIPLNGTSTGIRVIRQADDISMLKHKKADCISTMNYNEYWQVIEAGMSANDLVNLSYQDNNVASLEDGIYIKEILLNDPRQAKYLANFIKASMQGWDYAAEHPDEAIDIILREAGVKDNNALKRTHQTRMLTEVLKLMKKPNWALDEADFQRTVHILSANGADPIITLQPKGAWSHAITDLVK
ncbi:MAG: ABC transporter substrate-binding protein [Alphaproteobacteria bacterium]|nr:ABC transporter substrate-binding protein [Alphaproteobacteria bacterium]